MKMRTDKYGTRLIEIEKEVPGVTSGVSSDGTHFTRLRGYIEPKPPYQPGDILYVRETYKRHMDGYSGIDFGGYIYKADCKYNFKDPYNPWRPSIHMPREVARIWLKVTDVRVERLDEVDGQGLIDEGIFTFEELRHGMMRDKFDKFERLWDSTIKKSNLDRYGWNANPWVWVIGFERCEKPEPCILRGIEPEEHKRPCIGYGRSDTDDEPCEMCKGCRHCSGNDVGEWREGQDG